MLSALFLSESLIVIANKIFHKEAQNQSLIYIQWSDFDRWFSHLRRIYLCVTFNFSKVFWAHFGVIGFKDVSLKPLYSWDHEFESRWKRGCLSLVCFLSCGYRPLGRADHLFRGVLLAVCGVETSTMRRQRSDLRCCVTEKKNNGTSKKLVIGVKVKLSRAWIITTVRRHVWEWRYR